MQFKIDENLPIEVAHLFNDAGYDAKTVNDQLLQGIKDKDLIDKCISEQRILITLDTDFSDIRTYPPEKNHGIIVLRVKFFSKDYILKVFRSVINALSKESVSQKLWIVEENKIRIRE